MGFFDRVEKLCGERGISLRQLAAGLKYSHTTVLKWKNGAVPRNSTVKAVADYFGVSVDWLLHGEPGDELLSDWQTIRRSDQALPLDSNEKALIEMYRAASSMGRMRIIQAVLNIHDTEKQGE